MGREGRQGGVALSMSLASFTGEWKTKQQLDTRSRTQASHILAHPHTHPPPLYTHAVIVFGVLGNQSKSKRTTEQTKHEPKIHANLVEN